jgi:hypothetical protein
MAQDLEMLVRKLDIFQDGSGIVNLLSRLRMNQKIVRGMRTSKHEHESLLEVSRFLAPNFVSKCLVDRSKGGYPRHVRGQIGFPIDAECNASHRINRSSERSA